MIRNFKDLSKKDIPAAGGKGANLGELVRIGMPVPSGFVITTEAYDKFVKENDLKRVINNNLKKASKIRSTFKKATIPKVIKTQILENYRGLDNSKVAVRSSATAEDLPEAAFAGQQDTFLNINGEKELLDSVRKTWASLWTDRAISYRENLGIDQAGVKMAVIVQEMVDAESSGVMFTANPVTGDRKEVVIDAASGLGESVVKGTVIPDHFLLRKNFLGWNVKRKSGKFKTPKSILKKLAKLGEEIEKHFDHPQDIEWAFADRKVFILQSRPITALPEPAPKLNKPSRILAGFVAEMFPRRPYPLEAVGSRLVIDYFISALFRRLGLRPVTVEELFEVEDGIFVRYTGRISIRPTPFILLAPIRMLWLVASNNPAKWEDDALYKEAIDDIRKLEEKSKKELSPAELISLGEETIDVIPKLFEVRIRYLPAVVVSIVFLYLMLTLARKRNKLGDLLFLDVDTKVTETNKALEDLAEKIRKDDLLSSVFDERETGDIVAELEKTKAGQDFLIQFEDFLESYGYRESGGTLLISEPFWKDSPETVLGILKTLIVSSKAKDTKKSFQEIKSSVLKNSFLGIQPFKSFFLRLLKNARQLHAIREDTRFYLMMLMSILRKSALELSKDLVRKGALKTTDDVYILTFNELRKVAIDDRVSAKEVKEIKQIVGRRKKKHKELEGVEFIDPRLYKKDEKNSDAFVTGTPGSPGVAEGMVRIIRNSSEFDLLQPGEVLVAPYTNPAWTPLFRKISAVVVDTGGSMSHAAIVAREYRIPAVMGTANGTEKIETGDQVRVDGSGGKVYLVD